MSSSDDELVERYSRVVAAFPKLPSIGHRKVLTEDEQQARRDQILIARHALALELVKDMDMMKPRPVWGRPAEVPDDDLEAWSTARQVRMKGSRAAAHERDAARMLGEWRYEVCKVEGQNAKWLSMLADAVATFVEIDEPSLDPQIDLIRQHVQQHWQVDVFDAPLRDGYRALDGWARDQCRRTDVIPTWLINGDKPPRFAPRGYAKTEDPNDFSDAITGRGDDDEWND